LFLPKFHQYETAPEEGLYADFLLEHPQ
jgi:hypothetical protein